MAKLTTAQLELLNNNPELKAAFEAKDAELAKAVKEKDDAVAKAVKERGEEYDAALADKVAQINDLKAKVKVGSKSLPVAGTYTSNKKKYKFKDGAVNTRLKNGALVPSEKLIAFANGEGTDADVAKYPSIKHLAEGSSDLKTIQNGCKDYMNYLVKIGYSLLVLA